MALDFQSDDNLDFQLDFQPDDAAKLENQNSKIGGFISGVGSFASELAGASASGLRTMGELATGASLPEALERSESSHDAITYEPSGKYGKATKKVMVDTMAEYAEDYASKFSGSQASVNKQKLNKNELSPADLRGENTERFVGDLIGGLYAPGLKVPSRRTAAKVRPDDPSVILDSLEKARAAEKAAKPVEFVPDEAINADVARLHDESIKGNLEQIDRELTLNENFKDIKQEDAQALAGERQAQIELDTKRQATLDYNAAERARQEAAPVGGEWGRALEKETNPEVRGMLHDLAAIDAKEGLGKTRTGYEAFTEPNSRFPSGKAKGQRGVINPEVFKEGFEKLKQLPDGAWLRAHSDGHELTVDVIRDSKKIGSATFSPEYTDRANSANRNAVPAMVKVEQGHKGKGLATEMYKFASELGNDVQASSIQSPDGTNLWRSMEAKGVAKDGIIKSTGNKQMGAIRLGEKKQEQMEKLPGRKNSIPENHDPKLVIEEALKEGQDSNQWNYTESGGTLAAMKRKSIAVLAAVRAVQNSGKHADLAIRKNVLPAEEALRAISAKELISLEKIMVREMFNGERFSHESMQNAGLSAKQLEAYANLRSMFEDAFRIENEVREAQGKPAITELEAYVSSRWQGDFRRPVFQTILDGQGNPKIKPDGSLERKLVWYLAAHTQRGLERQYAALKKEHPDLGYNPKDDHVVRYFKRQTDLQSVYTTLLDILGRDDPAVAKIQEAVENQAKNEAASFLNQEKHFKEKANVRGFVGDRPGHSGKSEALAFFQQQIQYAKNAYKWSEAQKAAKDIKEIVSNPELVEQQPNNIKYIKEYFKNSVGYGEARIIAHLEDAIRDVNLPFSGRISPTLIDKGVGGLKTTFILSKLAVNAGYTIAGLIQTFNVLPHLADLRSQGHKGNPVAAMLVGIPAGVAMATGHYAQFLNGGKGMPKLPGELAAFYERAFKYAEENGVTARSIYDESPIESSFSAVGAAANLAGKTMAVPEVAARSMAFMTFVQMLKDSKKFKSEQAMFQLAEERTNAAMVDYRAQERPMVFSKLGTLGNFLNTLQTYPMNWYNQWNYMGREAATGNLAPAMTMIGLQYAVAGAMGIPLVDDMMKLYDFAKDHMTNPEMYVKMQESKFWSNPKMWMVENFGQSAVYGALSDMSGIGLTSRVAAPGAGGMLQSPAGPVLDIGKQIYHAGALALDPTNKTKQAQSAMASTPPGLQGLVETATGMEGSTFEKRTVDGKEQRVYQRSADIMDHKGTYARTPEEDTLRKWGLRSQKEVVEREASYMTDKATRVGEKKAQSIPNSFYDAVKRNDLSRARALYTAHVKLTGKGITSEQLESQIRDSYITSSERSSMNAKSVIALQNVARMRALFKQIEEENQK
jgi:hypothetical protein